MGVQTPLTKSEAEKLFPAFEIENLQATHNGVMDTTYLTKKYVLKHYEREIREKLERDKKLLQILEKEGCNTPKYIASSGEWHLYSRLDGTIPRVSCYFHIQALARFLATLHSLSLPKHPPFLAQYKLKEMLLYTKKHHFAYYKKLASLRDFSLKEEGFIHGDIFLDNTLFDGEKIAVFDFIDGGAGAFSFDIAVALMAFNPAKRRSYTKLFLQTYNQRAPKKVTLQRLQKEMQNGAKLYALARIVKYRNVKRAKELIW